MPQFHFRLDKVQHVRQSAREQRRLDLLETQRAEDQMTMQIADLQAELQSLRSHTRSAIRPGHLDLDELLHTQRYEKSLRGDLESAQNRREALTAEAHRRRQALVEADREVKVLDRLHERQLTQHRIDEARRQTNRADDRATQMGNGEWGITVARFGPSDS